MKKIISILAVLLVLTSVLPLAVFAEETAAEVETEAKAICTCDTVPATKYCPTCGGLHPQHARYWDCTCGTKDNFTAFCPTCGEKHPNHDGCWDCSTCGMKDNFHDTCVRCGADRPHENTDGAKFEIKPDTLKDTLPIMGMGMLGIFLVIGTIVLAVIILRKLPEKKEE